jgi:hypothetical protein
MFCEPASEKVQPLLDLNAGTLVPCLHTSYKRTQKHANKPTADNFERGEK